MQKSKRVKTSENGCVTLAHKELKCIKVQAPSLAENLLHVVQVPFICLC